MVRVKNIFLATTFIFIGLLLLIKPSLSHSGHDHNLINEETQKLSEENNLNQETEEIEQEFLQSDEIVEDNSLENESFNNHNTQIDSDLENSVESPSAISSKESDLIPQPSESVSFLLLVSPYLLYTIKRKIYKRESN